MEFGKELLVYMTFLAVAVPLVVQAIKKTDVIPKKMAPSSIYRFRCDSWATCARITWCRQPLCDGMGWWSSGGGRNRSI